CCGAPPGFLLDGEPTLHCGSPKTRHPPFSTGSCVPARLRHSGFSTASACVAYHSHTSYRKPGFCKGMVPRHRRLAKADRKQAHQTLWAECRRPKRFPEKGDCSGPPVTSVVAFSGGGSNPSDKSTSRVP